MEFDPVLQSPKWLAARDGFLTGPKGEGRSISPATAQAIPAQDPDRPIKALLREHRALFGHGPEVLAASRRARDYVTTRNGLRTVVWEQQLEGIPVQDGALIANVTRKGELVCLSSRFAPDPGRAAETELPNFRKRLRSPGIPARDAVVKAAENLGETLAPGEIVPLVAPGNDPEQRQSWKAGELPGEARASLVWLPMDRARMRLCWAVELGIRPRGHRFLVLVDAMDGRAHLRRSRTFDLAPSTYRVFTSDSPSPFSPSHPARSTVQPPVVPRTLVTLSALSTNASPIGWIRDGENETRGNNVDAYLDRNGDDWPDLSRPQGAPFRVFDFQLDLSRDPAQSSDAAVVQLFYWCNWMHDRLYELGFTEAAGNMQKDNFSRGGLGHDPLLAEAQDGADFNNANYSATRDGSSPRIQMYLFNGPEPWRDAALDAEVILHEYAHGLTDRLLGGGTGIYGNQGYGLGEGWSDFYALALLSEPGDDPDAAYAYGGYMTYGMNSLRENYYFGIRRFPYTTDLSRNPLTLGDLYGDDIARHPAVPRNPMISSTGAEAHRMGEVWCATLWEARAKLIHRYGFAEGNQLILQLVTDSLKLLPANPTFVEARDAILLADAIGYEGANRLDLWDAFGKRGLGIAARTQDDLFGGAYAYESFAVPDALEVRAEGGLSFRGPVEGPFTPGASRFALQNVRITNLAWAARSELPWMHAEPAGGELAGAAATNVNFTLTAEAGLLPAGIYTNLLVILNTSSGYAVTQKVVLGIGQSEFLTEVFDNELFDLGYTMLAFTPDGSSNDYSVCHSEVAGFPVDPAGGEELVLVDDAYRLIALADGKEISLFGVRTNQFFLGSNGDVIYEVPAYYTNNPALGLYTQYFHPEISTFFERSRVGAFYADLNPGAGGSVSWKQLPDRAALTYQGVPEYGKTNTNNFQVELWFNGIIRMTYLATDVRSVMVGLSRGAGVTNFISSKLKDSPACYPPLRLEAPVGGTEGDPPLQGTVTLAQAGLEDVRVDLQANDPAAVEVGPLIIPAGQTKAPFPIFINEDLLLNGTREVVITGWAANHEPGTATLEIDDNETAALSVSLPPNAREEDGLMAWGGAVTLSRIPDGPITVQLWSSQPEVVQVPPAITIQPGQTSAPFDLVVLDDHLFNPPRTVLVLAQVRNWTGGFGAIEVADNEDPKLQLTLPAQMMENGATPAKGRVELGGWLSTNLALRLSSAAPLVLRVPEVAVLSAGESSVEFDLAAPDNTETNGPVAVRVAVAAPGFAGAEGQVLVLDDESPPTPAQPEPPDLAGQVSHPVRLAWSTVPAAPAGAVGFEVYLGTNPAPAAAEFQGRTGDAYWPLGKLENGVTYYWQIVSRRGDLRQSGPVWQFTTARLTHFEITPETSAKQAGAAFSVTITARDESGRVAEGFDGRLSLSGARLALTTATLVITEVSTADPEKVEFMNVSGRDLDITGWQAVFYDWAHWPEPASAFTFSTRTLCPAGNVFVVRDAATLLSQSAFPLYYLSTNIAWNSAPMVNPIAVLLRDGAGNLIDFMCANDAHPRQITQPLAIPEKQWTGGPVSFTNQSITVFQRVGDRDHNDARDWTAATGNLGSPNDGLTVPFSGEEPAPLSPELVEGFTNGVWTGAVTVSDPAEAVWLTVNDTAGHSGVSDPFTVAADDDLSVQIQALPAMLWIGGQFTCSLLVTNSGPAAVTEVKLADRFSTVVEVVSVSATQGACTMDAGGVACDLGTLDPGATASVTVEFKPKLPGSLTNEVSVICRESESYLANNTARLASAVDYPWLYVYGGGLIEGQTGTTNVVFPVRLSATNAETVTVNFATRDGTAMAGGDYVATNGTLSIPPGATEASIVVPVLGDSVDESNEVFYVSLSVPVNAVLANTSAAALIINDDSQSSLSVSIDNVTVIEGDGGAAEVVFTATLNTPVAKPVLLYYATVDGTASAGFDYVPASGPLWFPVGMSNQTVRVQVLGDTLLESNETFQVKITRAAGAFYASATGTCTITDDDAGQLNRFEWEIPSATPLVEEPFSARLSARDGAGRLVANFNGAAAIRAGREFGLATVGAGTNLIAYPLGAESRDLRLQVIYSAAELGRAGYITALALNVATLPGQTLSHWTIRLKHTSRTYFSALAWDNDDWVTVFRADQAFAAPGWADFVFQTPFEYNGVDPLMAEFSFSNTGLSKDGLCRATATKQTRVLGYRSDGAFGDPLTWSEFSAPPPLAIEAVPNVRFSLETPVAIAGGLDVGFTDGSWSEPINFLEAAPDVFLFASDAQGHTGRSSLMQVSELDSDGDGLPDRWEKRYGLDPRDPTDALLDNDHDGVTNGEEFLAGTDPTSPESVLRITSIEAVQQGIRLTFPTAAGKRYLLESVDTLGHTPWLPVSGIITGTGKLYSLTFANSQPTAQFYRLRVVE